MPQFKATPESQQMIEDLALSAKIKALLINDHPTCGVTSTNGSVAIEVRASLHTDTKLAETIEKKVLNVQGVASATVKLRPAGFFS